MRILKVKKITYKAADETADGAKRLKEIEIEVDKLWKNAVQRMRESGNRQTTSVKTLVNMIDRQWNEYDRIKGEKVANLNKSEEVKPDKEKIKTLK
jgi:hypothetical protein